MTLGRWFIRIAPSVSGRDRWLVGWRNTTRWAWDAPRWLSWVSR